MTAGIRLILCIACFVGIIQYVVAINNKIVSFVLYIGYAVIMTVFNFVLLVSWLFCFLSFYYSIFCHVLFLPLLLLHYNAFTDV